MIQPLPRFFYFPAASSIGEELLAREWFLNAGSGSGSDLIYTANFPLDTVRCKLQLDVKTMITPDHRSVYTLFVTATVSTKLDACATAPHSPRAIVDQYIGTHDHPDAPSWLSWSETRYFPMSRAGFIGLFANMAMWPENLGEFNLSISMIKWCSAVSAGTWAEFECLGPATPLRPSVPRNTEPQRCEDWLRQCTVNVFESPTRSRSLSPSSEEGDCGASGYDYSSDVPFEPIEPLVLYL
ncbi:hypothetical protein C8F04DRAFT_1306012 [Mycena alexandri]|uniref:Uncharacterized protein n=1 Tax=Mycena alexandri TaxID=1745969 RepID=A0AAD6S925_9AGAR|nr:hypothetical protein C8F04DRAFT_1306012 [Mycena alexandri]